MLFQNCLECTKLHSSNRCLVELSRKPQSTHVHLCIFYKVHLHLKIEMSLAPQGTFVITTLLFHTCLNVARYCWMDDNFFFQRNSGCKVENSESLNRVDLLALCSFGFDLWAVKADEQPHVNWKRVAMNYFTNFLLL